MNLYLCSATGPIGMFSDYIWAGSRDEAAGKFHNTHGTLPHLIQLVKK